MHTPVGDEGGKRLNSTLHSAPDSVRTAVILPNTVEIEFLSVPNTGTK